jgi:parvulin-like peptidyl-prolyl isomerase
LDSFTRDPVKDLETAETPRLSRSQSPMPPSPHDGRLPAAYVVGAPPPIQPIVQVGNPPPLQSVQPPSSTAPPAIQPAVSKVASPEPSLPGQPAYQVKVAAWVNGKPIFHEDVMQAILPELARLRGMSQRQAEQRAQEVYDLVLDQFIDRELLYQDAMHKLQVNPKALKKLKEIQKEEFQKRLTEIRIKNKMTDEQFMDSLRRAGLTLQHMQRTEERKFFADEYLRSLIFPLIQRGASYATLKEYYDNHASEFQRLDSVDWQDIFIASGTKRNPTREHAYRFAVEIANRLRQGADIARLIEFDDGDSKSRNGEGSGHHADEIAPPQLARFLFGMCEGEVGPIVEIETGFHVIRVTRREFAGPIPFDEKTQKIISHKLRNEVAERESKRIVHELRSPLRSVIEKTGHL